MTEQKEQQAQQVQNMINSLKAEVYDAQTEARNQIQQRDNFVVELARMMGMEVNGKVIYADVAAKLKEILDEKKKLKNRVDDLEAQPAEPEEKPAKRGRKKAEKEGS